MPITRIFHFRGQPGPGRFSVQGESERNKNPGTGGREFDPGSWVERHGDFLYQYAYFRLRNQAHAEDAVQETFLAALGSARSFRGDASERTWLVSILRHKVFDQFRKIGRERTIEDLGETDEALDKLFNEKGLWKSRPSRWTADPGDLAESAEFWGVFEECLENLPERTAQAFSLRVLDNENSEDICKVLRISPNNLWVLLHRARFRLRECLDANWFSMK